ncbi:DUF4426 domain-containing protein [Motiliproteus sp. MSK22-1]|uniref:DUF4426 domain-containing protein n=1 Tax=Motiliproteus sp. MSK22-1 TaxID=1897630 RepID=UPI001E28DE2A|nr:DUF4426 domain-containing protein [Motiliproteus sp. MSK22-1]
MAFSILRASRLNALGRGVQKTSTLNVKVMKLTALSLKTILLIPLLWLASHAGAEQFKPFDNYEVHYNAFNSSFVTPEVASAYNLQRSKSRALMNIAVLKVADSNKLSVKAMVKGTMKNLIGQSQDLDFTEIREGESIYYIASFRFTDDEVLKFELDVQPDPNKPAYKMSFQQHFYAD